MIHAIIVEYILLVVSHCFLKGGCSNTHHAHAPACLACICIRQVRGRRVQGFLVPASLGVCRTSRLRRSYKSHTPKWPGPRFGLIWSLPFCVVTMWTSILSMAPCIYPANGAERLRPTVHSYKHGAGTKQMTPKVRATFLNRGDYTSYVGTVINTNVHQKQHHASLMRSYQYVQKHEGAIFCHRHLWIRSQELRALRQGSRVCLCVRCMYIYIYCICVYIYICTYLVCMYACVCTCIDECLT